MLGRMQEQHVLGAGSLAAGALVLVLFLPGARGAWSDLQTAPPAPACPSLTPLSSNRMGDAHAQFPLRTKLASHWMSLLLQTNTLKNLFQVSKKCEFSVLKMLKMCFPRTQICSPLLLQLLCSPAHLCMPGDRVPGVWHREDTILCDLSALPGSSCATSSSAGMTSWLFL